MRGRRLRYLTVIFALAAAGAIAWLIDGPPTNGAVTQVRGRLKDNSDILPVAEVKRTDLARHVTLTAEFKPYQDIEVMAKVAGYVKQIYVDVGDRVKRGQLLAVLEVPEMADELIKAEATVSRSSAEVARAHDEIRRAESAHQMAHLAYTRIASVLETRPGLVAQQEIDDAHSRDLMAEAQVAAAKSNLEAAGEAVRMNRAEQSRLKTLMGYTRVLAPFDGVITRRFADTGSMIQAGTASQTQAMPLVRLAQNSMLRLILPVPESAVPKVRLGQSVDVSVPSLDRSFRGHVARYADNVDRSTRTMLTEVDVPNSEYLLVPGMYATVSLALDQRRGTLAVPLSAIDPGEQVSRVYVVNKEGLVQVRDVQLGIESSRLAEVRSGLHEGDLVVTGRRAGLKPGQRVTPKLAQLASAD